MPICAREAELSKRGCHFDMLKEPYAMTMPLLTHLATQPRLKTALTRVCDFAVFAERPNQALREYEAQAVGESISGDTQMP